MHSALFLIVLFALLLAVAYPLSRFVQLVFGEGEVPVLGRVVRPVERLTYRVMNVDPDREQRWWEYGRSVVVFSVIGVLLLYLIQRIQGHLPLNPTHMVGVSPALAFNTAVSFVTNTNWQSYSPEVTMSYLTQLIGLTFQNFASAAVGLSVAIALFRAFARSGTQTIGNFWRDLVRGTLYILIPIALVLAIVFVSQGVIETFHGPVTAHVVGGHTQTIFRGPFASQEAIKELGNNGGGTFNANSTHPFENPTPLSNFLQIFSFLLLPFTLPFVFGRMLGRVREGAVIFIAMGILLSGGIATVIASDHHLTPALQAAGVTQGRNMEGKEQRFTLTEVGTFVAGTTGTSTGAVNASHDSLTSWGGLAPLALMKLGELSPGGIGVGMYSMLLQIILTVFLSGLMIGRTPEYLGKRIGQQEIKLGLIGILIMPVGLLVTLGIAVLNGSATSGIENTGPHGFSEILYALTSAWNNNGSAFGGYTVHTFMNVMLAVGMWFGRFAVMIPVLALAGAIGAQKTRPVEGSMPTTSPIFLSLLVGVILIVGALAFFPALALGPIAEGLTHHLS